MITILDEPGPTLLPACDDDLRWIYPPRTMPAPPTLLS